ncbi:hypothetical protein HYQ45_016672 [Verticillium longisporum]|uniref:2EXR domain-containing protein n=1 Tax=Verticillium longisporum TaxID=100787 RepID=A0A8I3AG67_VERLO|nr:hypothetical protein HYQ45_016672 [Verticillium longisporum]
MAAFRPFQRLPPELRLKVWEYTWPEPQIVDEDPLEACPDPIALRINQESRIHTLRRHVRLQHPTIPSATFYFNPHSDLLCLTVDVDEAYLADLQKLYGPQLKNIRTIVVDQNGFWEEDNIADDTLRFFDNLKLVYVLLDVWDDGESEIMTKQDCLEMAEQLRSRDAALLKRHKWCVKMHCLIQAITRTIASS